MSKLILFFLVLLMFCSCQKNQCACALKSQFEYQRFETNEYVIIINLIDNGAFGETADLLVCTKDKQLIEEIGIRCEDAKPKIEKVTNDRIYISYDYTFLGLKKKMRY
uniref:hypothetical protein n=1 Tax=Flavobacterium sp. TaxID=239 RepID=UPI004049915C